MVMRAFVRDVDEQGFQQGVIERSYQVPVVVDFWAPWCGPCRQLGPMLEALITSYGGQIELAKVNTDLNPTLARRYGIEGIPAVKGFRDGRVATEFTGALPESQVRTFLQRLLPSRADLLAEEAVRQAYAGETAPAEATYREALAEDRGHRSANIGLARLLIARDAVDEAKALLANVPGDAEAQRLRAELSLREATGSDADASALEQTLAADPANVDARYRLAMALAARRDYQPALEHLLEVVRRDRAYQNDAGRKAMLEIFALLGDADPLTHDYRRRLGMLLF